MEEHKRRQHLKEFSHMCIIIITDDCGNNIYCQYGADEQNVLEAYKYLKHRIGEKVQVKQLLGAVHWKAHVWKASEVLSSRAKCEGLWV